MRYLRIAAGFAALTMTVLLLAGCPTPFSPEELMDQLASLQDPPNLANVAAAPMIDTAIDAAETLDTEYGEIDGTAVIYVTTEQEFSVSAAFDTQTMLAPSSDVIYPGSVLMGHTIDDGRFMEVTSGTRRDITVSFDLSGVTDSEGNAGFVSGTIVPTLSNYRELYNALFVQDIPPQSTNFSYEMIEIDSSEEFNLKINAGANYSNGVIETDVRTNLDLENQSTSHKIMVRYMETFYTVDIDQGEGTFLYSDFDLEDFGGYRPVYVSSVAYGRLAFLTIESEADSTTIQQNLNVAFDATKVSGDVDLDLAMGFFNTETTTKVTVMGASEIALSVEAFRNLLVNDTFSDTNRGQIVAYKLRFVDDNSVARTVFNGTYTARDVQAVEGTPVGLQVTGLRADIRDGIGDEAEIYGEVYFERADPVYPDTKALWEYPERDPYDIRDDYRWVTWNGDMKIIGFQSPDVESIVIGIRDFYEDDGNLSSADRFTNEELEIPVSDLTNGEELFITTYYTGNDSEKVQFRILVSVP